MSTGPTEIVPPPTDAADILVRGSTIGRYVVLGLVGRGGMGEVYAAYDPELDRKVALKLLRIKPGNGVSLTEGRQRTLREAQAIARLSHPNVVVVYDVGTFRGQVFIAMEFVEGHTVSYWVASKARTWEETLKVFIDAGRGLMAAHKKGLVHRDFKPDNVMVGEDGQVRVMDFGLARQMNEKTSRKTSLDGKTAPEHQTGNAPLPLRLSEPGSEAAGPAEDPLSTIVLNGGPVHTPPISMHSSTGNSGADVFGAQLTRTGAMMGTPAYMAPEQFLGAPTDARTDQFSFCVALYEALYGDRPFYGNTMFALTTAVVQGNVKEPPANSKVPFWVRKVLLRGLRPKADDRFPSMEALIDALGRDPRLVRRRAVAVATGVVAVAALLGGWRHSVATHRLMCSGGPAKLAGVWDVPTGNSELEPPRHAAIRASFLHTGKGYAADAYSTVSRILSTYADGWLRMYTDTCEAAQRGDQSAEVLDLRMSCLQERLSGLRALTDVFSDANAEVVEKAVSAANNLRTLERCADVALLRAVVRPPEDPATRAKVADLRHSVASVKALLDSGRWREAMKGSPPLVEQAKALGYEPLTAEALGTMGMAYLKGNDPKTAEHALVESYWFADASRHDEVRAEDAMNLVWVIGYEQGRYEEAQGWARSAKAVLQRLGGHELLEAWLLNNLGGVYELEGQREEALRSQQEALTLKEEVLGNEHPDVGISEGNLAVVLSALGRNQEALAHVDRSIQILASGLGAGHPDLATQLNNRGEILNALGRHREARGSFEKARIIWERELGLDDRNLAYALTGIGISYLSEADPTSGIVPLERAFKIREARETDPSRRAETRFALARALWAAGRDRGRARALAEQAREAYGKIAAEDKVAEIAAWTRNHDSR
jgi:eukaryotic-like serine/threonine-protein kinase